MNVWDALDGEFARFPELAACGVPESTINAAEIRLGCKFAESYRRFLRQYGAGLVGDGPILGLARAEAMGEDLWSVVETTERFRRDNWPGADVWYIVSVDGSGNPVGVDAQGSVWLSDHDVGEVVAIASSFEELLRLKCAGP
ncbi:MAG: SMI1/KNR4 family protein [Myxococcales bacterium]|jgi:hypothetical protein|nr:SMI1/KNR4 family protein [Myxococcales bacterium]